MQPKIQSLQYKQSTAPTGQKLLNDTSERYGNLETYTSKFHDIPVDSKFIHQKSERFDFTNPPFDPIKFAYELADRMIRNNGLGLAAPQIEIPYNIIAVKANPVLVMYNPKLIDLSEELIELEEGCLSYPGIYINKIKRPRVIRVRYTEPNGNTVTKQFQDLTARVIQHEIDHLDGITMFDRTTPMRKEKAMRELKKVKRSRK